MDISENKVHEEYLFMKVFQLIAVILQLKFVRFFLFPSTIYSKIIGFAYGIFMFRLIIYWVTSVLVYSVMWGEILDFCNFYTFPRYLTSFLQFLQTRSWTFASVYLIMFVFLCDCELLAPQPNTEHFHFVIHIWCAAAVWLFI